MGEVELRYRQVIQEREKKRVDAFANDTASDNIDLTSANPFEAKPAVTAPAAPKSEGLLGALASPPGENEIVRKRLVDTGATIYQHFSNGLYNVAQGKGYSKQWLSGAGELLLGGLTVAAAIPGVAGAAVEQAMKSYLPGMEKSVALGRAAAGFYRQTMAGFALLDPEFRKQFENAATSEAALNDLYKEMTYGELFDTITQFATPFAIPIAKAMRGAKAPPPPIPEPVPLQIKRALAADAGPSYPLAPQTARPAPANWITPETVSARLAIISEELRGGGGGPAPKVEGKPAKGEALGPKDIKNPEGVPTEPSGAVVGQAIASNHLMELRDAMFGAEKPIQDILMEQLLSGEKGEVPTPKAVKGGELIGNKTKAEWAAELKTRQEGKVEGGMHKTTGEKLGPTGEPITFDEPSMGASFNVAAGHSLRKGGGEPGPKLGAFPGNIGKEMIPVLTRMIIGGAIGGTQGDTAEERIQYILAGMVGGAIAKPTAKLIVNKLLLNPKTAPLLSEANPKIPGYSVPKAGLPELRSGDLTSNKLLHVDSTKDTFTTADRKAAANIELQAMQRVYDITQQVKNGEPIVPGSLMLAVAEASQLSAKARKTPMASGTTYAAPPRWRLEGRVQESATKMHELANTWDPNMTDAGLAKLIDSIPKKSQIDGFVRMNYAVPEFIIETMYGMMLGGKAIVKNAAGMALEIPLSMIDRSFGALKLNDPARPRIHEMGHDFVATWEGITEQVRLIKDASSLRAAWELQAEQARQMGTTHVENQARGYQALSDLAGESGWPMISKGIDYLHNVVSSGPEVMIRTDGAGKALNGRRQLHQEAMRQAEREGLHKQAYWDRVANIVDDFSQLDDSSAIVRIHNFRNEMTFTQPLEAGLARAAHRGFENPWADLVWRMTFGAFVRTPLRLMERAMERTPLLNRLTSAYARDIEAGGTGASVASGKVGTGVLMSGTFTYLAMQGLINGDPIDNQDRRTMEAAGRPPRTWWDPVSGKWRSYAGMEPFSSLVAFGANMASAGARLPEGDVLHLLLAAGLAWGGVIEDNVFMTSASQFVDAVKVGYDDSKVAGMLEYVRRATERFRPAVLTELESAVDPEIRKAVPRPEYQHNLLMQEVDMLFQNYRKGIPFASMATNDKNQPIVARDQNMFTGDFLVSGWPYNPLIPHEPQEAPWAKAIQRLNGAGLKPIDEWIGTPQRPDAGMTTINTKPSVKLDGPQQERLITIMTKEIKDGRGNLIQSLDALVQDKRFLNQPDSVQADLIKMRWSQFRQAAEEKFVKENEDVQRKLRENQRKMIRERLPLDDSRRKIGVTGP